MGYNLSKAFCSCWSCGYHRLGEVLSELTNESYPKVKEYRQALKSNLDLSDFTPKSSGKLIIPSGVKSLLPQHKKYLEERGFDPKHISDFWGVQGIGVSHRLQWRLWIPVHYGGRIVSWTTRSICRTAKERYINARPEEQMFPIKDLLYGEDHCRHTILVLEGPIDVWKVGPGAVATFGSTYTKEQVLKISKYPKRGIAFDNEPQAQLQAKRLCEELEVFPGQTYLIQLRSKDAGSASREEIRRLRGFIYD